MYYRRNHWFPSSLRFKWVKICKALTVPPKLVLFYPFHPYHHLYYELPIHQALPPLLSARPFLAKTGNIYDPLHGYLRASAFFFFTIILNKLTFFKKKKFVYLVCSTFYPNRKLSGTKDLDLFYLHCCHKFRSTVNECMGET